MALSRDTKLLFMLQELKKMMAVMLLVKEPSREQHQMFV